MMSWHGHLSQENQYCQWNPQRDEENTLSEPPTWRYDGLLSSAASLYDDTQGKSLSPAFGMDERAATSMLPHPQAGDEDSYIPHDPVFDTTALSTFPASQLQAHWQDTQLNMNYPDFQSSPIQWAPEALQNMENLPNNTAYNGSPFISSYPDNWSSTLFPDDVAYQHSSSLVHTPTVAETLETTFPGYHFEQNTNEQSTASSQCSDALEMGQGDVSPTLSLSESQAAENFSNELEASPHSGQQHHSPSPLPSPSTQASAQPHHPAPIVKRCWDCGAAKAPTWRRDPDNRALLMCNACGLRARHRGNRPSTKGMVSTEPRIKSLNPNKTCSHCTTQYTTAWRRGKDKKLLCNACGVYLATTGVNRPLHLAKVRKEPSKRRRNPYPKNEGGYRET